MSRIEHKPAALMFNGKRTVFRSRLEARWATYFASRSLQWEYEPFKFPIGGKGATYTPDFKVDGIGIIEVKPYFDALADSVDRIERYVEKTKERVYLFHGSSPAKADAMILFGNPLKGYRCDAMQRVLILGGEDGRAFAIKNFDAFNQSVEISLNAASSRDVLFDPLSIGELLAFDGAMDRAKPNEARGKTILRRLLMREGKDRAA